MTTPLHVLGWPDDDDPQAYDVRCPRCGESARLNQHDVFVEQVLVFSRAHRGCTERG